MRTTKFSALIIVALLTQFGCSGGSGGGGITTPVETSPSAPTNLSAIPVSASRINLTWVDNSNNETGFRIERKIGLNGTYAPIAVTTLNTTSYSDTGLAPTSIYFYRIRSINSVGDSNTIEASATTLQSQSITSNINITPSLILVGGTNTLSASSSSGLGVIFSSSTPSVCTVNGLAITGVSAGLCTIVATQPGNATYEQAQTNSNFSVIDPDTTGTITDSTTGMVLRRVPGGTFTMGNIPGDTVSNGVPNHQVTISDFYIGVYEVTQAQWIAVMGSNPSYFNSCGMNCPVEYVSWNDIQTYINTLNSINGTNYRLPTEAEWEYSARSAGQNQYYSGGSITMLSDLAWVNINSDSKTHPVGLKQKNLLGLYDMTGNLYEWVSDWVGDYPSTAQVNPTGPSSNGIHRVLRGGGWGSDPVGSTAFRDGAVPSNRSHSFGFRLAKPAQ